MGTTQHAAGVDYVLDLEAIDATQLALAGGKGASLGELSRVEGIRVPPGFCVTADAFRRIVAPAIEDRLDRLSLLDPDDRDGIRTLSEEIRRAIEAIAIPGDLAAAITGALDERAAYAVRSSATAEDLPTASFAGQQDSYLNVVGPAAILEHVSRCWASLFTERAVSYRDPERLRPPQGADGRRRAADGPRARGRDPLHGGPRHVQPQRRRGGGGPRPRRGAGVRPGEPRPLHGARRRDRRQGDRRRAGGADRCAGHRARAARPADRGALRPPAGHRVVPRRRRVPDRPEPADHHAVPHPRER